MNFNPQISNLPIYEAGKPIELVIREFGINPKDIIKLASNENPLGCSPLALEAMEKSIKSANLYPDDSYYELKESLANLYNVNSKNIVIGSGSDQVIEFIMHAKLDPSKAILSTGVTFAMYGIYAQHIGAKIYKTTSPNHNLNELKALYNQHKNEIKVIFLCLPNNPLGECLDASEVYEFISGVDSDTLVVIDGAYMEFAKFKDKKKAINPKDIVLFSNAIYLGTFSKAYGLGGMRVGYGIANELIINGVSKLRAPFNITTPSLAAAIAAIKDQNFIDQTLQNNLKEMSIYEKFAQDNHIEFIPSYTNFITFVFDNNKNSTKICDNLLRKGIILRNLQSYGLNAIRITIGTKEQNIKVLEALKKEI
ncbi:MAG: histidinol-phosphate transaminase [Campylobacter lanienae]|uniref:histidinol-phosphate transaminase n=1 Tax=Campylobacter lanienae TaxID=75658 RepID=UPI00242F7636|nr:histidinol-phosphate transaminase [Campylobacter lanienae]MCI7364475.1 histidinol-phosphate transaminase [Campylobacter lanienae]